MHPRTRWGICPCFDKFGVPAPFVDELHQRDTIYGLKVEVLTSVAIVAGSTQIVLRRLDRRGTSIGIVIDRIRWGS